MGLEYFLERGAAVIEQTKQQVFGADVIVFELAGLGLRGVERLLQIGAEEQIGGTDALDLAAAGQFAFEVGFELGRRHPESGATSRP